MTPNSKIFLRILLCVCMPDQLGGEREHFCDSVHAGRAGCQPHRTQGVLFGVLSAFDCRTRNVLENGSFFSGTDLHVNFKNKAVTNNEQ